MEDKTLEQITHICSIYEYMCRYSHHRSDDLIKIIGLRGIRCILDAQELVVDETTRLDVVRALLAHFEVPWGDHCYSAVPNLTIPPLEGLVSLVSKSIYLCYLEYGDATKEVCAFVYSFYANSFMSVITDLDLLLYRKGVETLLSMFADHCARES